MKTSFPTFLTGYAPGAANGWALLRDTVRKASGSRIVGTVVIGVAIASTVDVLVRALFVLAERLVSRGTGEAPGVANVPQLSPSEGD